MKKLFPLAFLSAVLVLNPLGTTDAAAFNQNQMWAKLGRGLGNITFCYLEIFRQIGDLGETERWPVAGFGGFFKGVIYTGVRAAAGVYETATFPLPLPPNYEPVMKPEFVVPAS